MVKRALSIAAAAVACIAQISFVFALPSPFNAVNVVLVYAVLVLFLKGGPAAWYHAAAFGLFLDLYLPYPFGIFMLSLGLGITAGWLGLRQFFTNRSVYSFVSVILLATLCFTAVRAVSIWIAYRITDNILYVQHADAEMMTALAYALAANALVIAVSFYAIHYFSNMLEPFFIRKPR